MAASGYRSRSRGSSPKAVRRTAISASRSARRTVRRFWMSSAMAAGGGLMRPCAPQWRPALASGSTRCAFTTTRARPTRSMPRRTRPGRKSLSILSLRTYRPPMAELLAHELTHVVRERRGPVDGSPAPGGIRLSDPGDRFEQAAAVANPQPLEPSVAAGAGEVTVQPVRRRGQGYQGRRADLALRGGRKPVKIAIAGSSYGKWATQEAASTPLDIDKKPKKN